MNIINELQSENNYKSFDDLYNDNKMIHYGSYFKNFYTNDVLFSDKARKEWVQPDL